MSKNSFIEARETAIKRAQEAPERQKEIVGKYTGIAERIIEEEQKYGKENVHKAYQNPTIYNLDGTRKENAPNYLPEGYEMVNGQAEYVGSTTSTVPSSTGTASKGGKSGTSGEGELVGEIKQSDYIDESSISFSRWELMGFIIALIVGIIVSALIVVAVKNNKRDRNRTVKNAIACDMESEAEAFMATLKAVKKQKRF